MDEGAVSGISLRGGLLAGTITQTGGTNSVAQLVSEAGGGLWLGFSATYNLISGKLNVTNEFDGAGTAYSLPGSFIQSGGTHLVSGLFYVGYGDDGIGLGNGTYSLSGTAAVLSAPTEDIGYGIVGYGAAGSFTQSGGTNAVGSLVLRPIPAGSAGTYNLNGGLLQPFGLDPGASEHATFNFSGGTFQAASSFPTSVPIAFNTVGSIGTFDTNGNMLTLAGFLSGPGGLQKIGAGTLTVTAANTYLGNTTVDAGTLQINGGKLPAAYEYIGTSGPASVVLSAGANAVSSTLIVGLGTAGTATYNLTSGSLWASNEIIGGSQNGSFLQTGGTHSVPNALYLGVWDRHQRNV